jgi:hypothetical protein
MNVNNYRSAATRRGVTNQKRLEFSDDSTCRPAWNHRAAAQHAFPDPTHSTVPASESALMTAHLLCFGELLLRLGAPGRELLLQSPRFEVQYGGAEANVAVGDVAARPPSDDGKRGAGHRARRGGGRRVAPPWRRYASCRRGLWPHGPVLPRDRRDPSTQRSVVRPRRLGLRARRGRCLRLGRVARRRRRAASLGRHAGARRRACRRSHPRRARRARSRRHRLLRQQLPRQAVAGMGRRCAEAARRIAGVVRHRLRRPPRLRRRARSRLPRRHAGTRTAGRRRSRLRRVPEHRPHRDHDPRAAQRRPSRTRRR